MTASLVGQSKKIKATFKDASGVLADPSTVILRIYLKTTTVDWTLVLTKQDAQLTHESTGVYSYYYTPVVKGTYRAEFTSYTSSTTPPTAATYAEWQVVGSAGTI